MSTDFVQATRALVERTVAATSGTPLALDAVRIEQRLAEPLRVAIAGRVKAGKSTLLNALVRDRLAATDAGECTTIVTEYHHSHTYDVRGRRAASGEWVELVARRGDRLEVELPDQDPDGIDRIAVAWPSSTLQHVTYIDTPGLASVNDHHSARTRSLLTPGEAGVSEADAVIYLLRHVHERDVSFLEAFMDRGVSLGTPLNAIGLLSRADEIGAGRLDAIESAGRIADRLGRDRRLLGLVSGVLPVAALLAETAATLTEAELALLSRTAAELGGDQARHLASADRFRTTPESSLAGEERGRLLARLGLFGVRVCIDLIHRVPDLTGSQIVVRLDALSGIRAVRDRIESEFLPRAGLLKARSALAELRRLALAASALDAAAAQQLLADVERIESAALDFARFRVLHLLSSGATVSPESQAQALRAARGGDPIGRHEALDTIESLRVELENPLLAGPAVELLQLTLRLHESTLSG